MNEGYSINVRRGEAFEKIPEPKVDGDTVRVICMPSRKEIAFELVFPTQESIDVFLSSDKTKKSAIDAGAHMTILTPQALIEDSAPEDQIGAGMKMSRKSDKKIEEALQVPLGELRRAQNKAWGALIASYQSRTT